MFSSHISMGQSLLNSLHYTRRNCYLPTHSHTLLSLLLGGEGLLLQAAFQDAPVGL